MKKGTLIFLVCGLLIFSVLLAQAQEEDIEALPPEPTDIEIPAFELEEEGEEALPPEEEIPAFEGKEGTVEPEEVPAEKAAAEEPEEMVEEPREEVEEASVRKRVLPEEAVPEGMELVLKAYEVKRGDCLHEIANRYYDDPSFWRKIWAYNKYIKDPHWIFPGDDLIIPTYRKAEVLAKAPRELEIRLEELAPGAEYERDVFIAPPDFEFDGYIVGVKEKKFMTAYGDLVFIDLGKRQNVMPKTRYTIYREGDEVIHPLTGELMGIIVEKIGVLEVTTEVEEDNSTVLIIDSRKPIEIGDSIKLQARLKEVETK